MVSEVFPLFGGESFFSLTRRRRFRREWSPSSRRRGWVRRHRPWSPNLATTNRPSRLPGRQKRHRLNHRRKGSPPAVGRGDGDARLTLRRQAREKSDAGRVISPGGPCLSLRGRIARRGLRGRSRGRMRTLWGRLLRRSLLSAPGGCARRLASVGGGGLAGPELCQLRAIAVGGKSLRRSAPSSGPGRPRSGRAARGPRRRSGTATRGRTAPPPRRRGRRRATRSGRAAAAPCATARSCR